METEYAAPQRRMFKRQMQADTRGGAMMRARLNAGMTQKALAEAAGISKTALFNWEHDIAAPTLSGAELVADVLGISLDEYVGHRCIKKRRADK